MDGTNALGQALRAARSRRGLTQQAAATAASLTQAHFSLIERGMDAHLSVFERAAAAVGCQVALEPSPAALSAKDPYGEDEIANRLYLLGRLAATRITADRIERFREWIEASRLRLGDYPYFKRWLAICSAGPDAIAAVFRDTTEYGRYMRAVATFRPFVSQQERDVFFQPSQVARKTANSWTVSTRSFQ